VLSPKTSLLGKLLDQYVRVRITKNDDSDIALFERDWNNTIYYFVMNADEQIYLRYGGRDARGPLTYLDFDSLELALKQGLELDQRYQRGELKKAARPKPLFAREIPPLVERTFARGQCVECHLIGDFQLIHKEQTGTLNKLTDMYRWPDIRTIGVELDIPKGLVVKEAKGPVQSAGMKAGDRIAALNSTPVYTWGDIQYRLDKVPRDAKQLALTVEREGHPVDLTVALPLRWWLTDLRFRQLSVDPRSEFECRPLSEEEKRKYGLKTASFAGEITRIGGFAQMMKIHDLKTGDIVTAVDGVDTDEIANTPELYIKLRKHAGDTVTVEIMRDGKRMKMPVNTQRMFFRK